VISFVRFHPILLIFGRNIPPGKVKQTHMHGPMYILFYAFILYLRACQTGGGDTQTASISSQGGISPPAEKDTIMHVSYLYSLFHVIRALLQMLGCHLFVIDNITFILHSRCACCNILNKSRSVTSILTQTCAFSISPIIKHLPITLGLYSIGT